MAWPQHDGFDKERRSERLAKGSLDGFLQDTILRCRVHRTFVEGVLLAPCPPRSRSWPDFSPSVVELLDEISETESPKAADCEPREAHEMQEELPGQPEQREEAQGCLSWDEAQGLPPGHALWNGVSNLMICNLPARCTRQELCTFLGSLVPGAAMNVTVPLSASGRNRGYGFVRAPESTITCLVPVLWQKCVPTRKSTRPLKLQPANLNTLQVSMKFC
ncbi:unnamed protein product [Symbiodinium pilosum]|uniref:RRM domain-containing protein n=1 Tax=Symbiodinium pilosum TaxID=2952 RepID=A0A812NXT0_SYMPI|nr:unnamed protein product [Symbiodinium pilosum]